MTVNKCRFALVMSNSEEKFELMSVNHDHSARSRGIIGISFRFSLT